MAYRKIIFTLLTIVFTCSLFAQEASMSREELRRRAKEVIKTNPPTSLPEYFKKHHPRTFSAEQKATFFNSLPSIDALQTKSTTQLDIPSDAWYPGEYEEVQAILVTWPYSTVSEDFEYWVDVVNDTIGGIWNGSSFTVSKYVSLPILDQSTRFPEIFAEVIDAIQKGNAEAWINIFVAEDSLDIKEYMEKRGTPLTNYRFFVNQGNSFWYRDCGPVAFYYGDNDDVAFMDFEYYGGRPMDDLIPLKIGNQAGFPVYTTTFEYEGGNILVDGAGTLFTSDMLYGANTDRYGLLKYKNGRINYETKKALTKAQVVDTLKYLFNTENLQIVPTLVNDGGTGHIDLYATMWDENNFVFTRYPEEMKSHRDYTISSQNIDAMLKLYTYHGDNLYKGKEVPLPKKDNGKWYTSTTDYKNHTRTYSNNLFVNNVIIQPIFSDEEWGDKEWDDRSLEILKAQNPGYEIIPIDIRGFKNNLNAGFDGSGGAIHCITKQIPAENPVRILHRSIQGFANEFDGTFPINATITNKSGIQSATCYWRVKGTGEWQTLPLQAGENNLFSATINRDASASNDTIQYYISATSNNGKTINKPFTAPKGYYTFYHGTEAQPEEKEDVYDPNWGVGIEDCINNHPFTGEGFSNFYPNPASDVVKMQITGKADVKMEVNIVTAAGQTVYTNSFIPESNYIVFEMNISSFADGIYYAIFTDNTGKKIARTLIVKK